MAKQSDKQVRVNLVVEGPLSEVMEIVGLALQEGLLKRFDQDEDVVHVGDVPKFLQARSTRKARHFQVGDYVKARGASEKYGLHGGEQGTVSKVYFNGHRSRVQVRWDDNTESDVGGSILEIVKVKK